MKTKSLSCMKKPEIRYVIPAVLVLFVLCVLNGLIAVYVFNEKLVANAQFGDSFGALNTFFTGLAFGVVWITLILQAKQIEQTREDQFKLNLFDKRFSIFKATQTFLNAAIAGAKNEDSSIFAREKQAALFLFKQDVVDYLETVYTKANYLKTTEDTSRLGLEKLKIDLLNELSRLNAVFGPSLKMEGI